MHIKVKSRPSKWSKSELQERRQYSFVLSKDKSIWEKSKLDFKQSVKLRLIEALQTFLRGITIPCNQKYNFPLPSATGCLSFGMSSGVCA